MSPEIAAAAAPAGEAAPAPAPGGIDLGEGDAGGAAPSWTLTEDEGEPASEAPPGAIDLDADEGEKKDSGEAGNKWTLDLDDK